MFFLDKLCINYSFLYRYLITSQRQSINYSIHCYKTHSFPLSVTVRKMAFLLVLIGFLCLNAVLTQQLYTSQFDNTDVDAILKNDRLVKQYVDCLVDKKPCTKQGQMLKGKSKLVIG